MLNKITIIFILFLNTSIAYTHGVNTNIIKKGIVGISVSEESGKPFYGKVFLYSPLNQDKPVILSQLNKNGMFFFKPDKPGKWVVFFKDQSGHGGRVAIQINKDMIVVNQYSSSLSYIHKIVIALSISWGLVGTALFFMKKKKTKTNVG